MLIQTKSVAILGSGIIGRQMARSAAAAGLNVLVANTQGAESLFDLIAELGPNARAVPAKNAAKAADIVVVAIPFAAYSTLSLDLFSGKSSSMP